MAAVKACSVLITGANRGLGLEMVKQLVEMPCSNRRIFACCRDPDGAKSKALREVAKKYPKNISIIRLDATDACSIKEAAQQVGSQLGKGGLNLLVNNAGILSSGNMQATSTADMLNAFNTNVMGSFMVTKEFLPYLRVAAKASGRAGMSCEKAAIVNISSVLGSMEKMPAQYHLLPAISYNISKAGLNMLTVCAALEFKPEEILFVALHPGWVRTDMGGEGGMLDPKESVEGLLQVMGSLTERQTGAFLDYTGNTQPW